MSITSHAANRQRSRIDELERRMMLCSFARAHEQPIEPGGAATSSGAAGTFAWLSGADNPQVRFESSGAAVNGKLYVFGGFFNGSAHTTLRSDVYDPATNAWTPIADMREPVTHVSQAVDGPLIYLAGGFEGNWPGGSVDYVRAYNTLTNAWTNGPSLPDDRGGGALVRLGRELHYFGGASTPAGSNVLTDFGTHWVLQLGPTSSVADDGASWTTAAEMPIPRNHMGGAVASGKIYAIGGQLGADEFGSNQSAVHAYDPATNTWSAVASMPRPLGHITSSTFAHNGRVVVAAGVTQGGVEEARVIEYDPASDTWVSLPTLPGPREGPVADAIGTRIVLATGEASGVPFADTWIGELEGTWETGGASSGALAQMPVALAEVAGGIVGKKLYLVGSGSTATLAYDLSLNGWTPAGALATRPFPGDHHAAEVVNGMLYLFGGLGAGSNGRVQIYDPVANAWSPGASMPFAAGSSASALIGGQVYVAGGIVGGGVTNQVARYDPVANAWTPLATMPQAVNHAAAATDGQRLFVFGGRTTTGLTNVDTVQIYDPQTNTWQSSHLPGSTIAPAPLARSGMGKAAYVNGEFYVTGGETFDPGVPLGVYDRVDIYSAVTNTWRPGTPMPTARHGIFPLAHADRIYVAGGGVQVGVSSSTILEVYNPVLVPYVRSSEFLFEQAPLRVRITFSEDVSASLAPADLSVRRLPGDPPFTPNTVNYDAATNTATFALTTPLPDGDYRATLLATGVSDIAGNSLAADVYTDFFVLAGDANRDRRVNLDDFNILAANFGQSNRTFSQGDFNYDGTVNLNDFNILASRFGVALAAPRDGDGPGGQDGEEEELPPLV